MKQILQNIVIHETARTLSAYYKMPYETAFNALTNGVKIEGYKISPTDYPIIAEYTLKALYSLMANHYITLGDIICRLYRIQND